MTVTGRVLVEILGGHGQVRARERVALDASCRFTIGRAVEADVVLDDPHVAALHASVEVTPDARVLLTDLGTINGVVVAGERHQGVQALTAPGGEFRLGRTLLRVRTAGQVVSPERPDHSAASDSGSARWFALACALALSAYVVYTSWLDAPRDLVSSAIAGLLAMAGVTGLWIAGWALLSRILTGEWRWVRHAATLFGAGAGFVVISNALGLAWFSLSLPEWQSRYAVFATALLAAALYQHLQHATHLARLRTLIVAVLLPALLAGAGLWLNWRTTQRDVNHIGISELFYPPALRLRDAGDADAFFADVRALRAEADRKRETVGVDEEGEEPEAD